MTQGYKTTEFWMSLVAVIIGALLASDVIPSDSPVIKIIGIASSILGALGYTAARGIVKSNQIKADALVGAANSANNKPNP